MEDQKAGEEGVSVAEMDDFTCLAQFKNDVALHYSSTPTWSVSTGEKQNERSPFIQVYS